MSIEKNASLILEKVGGAENVVTLVHCMTRLRFTLKDESLAKGEEIKKIEGVMGIAQKGGQYMVIVGGSVAQYYNEIMRHLNVGEAKEAVKAEKEKLTPGKLIGKAIDVISGTTNQFLPALLGCGMVKILVTVIGMAGVDTATNMTCRILSVVGDSCFYFLPILVAVGAARKFGCNPMTAAVLAGILVHPDLIALLSGSEAVSFLGVPITEASYSYSVIPALLTVWILSYVERAAERILPDWSKAVFKPFFVLLVTAPIMLVIVAPAGYLLGQGLQTVITVAQAKASWLTMMLFSGFMPFLVLGGLHSAFTPTALEAFASGTGDSLLFPALLCSNLAIGGVCLAVCLSAKDKNMKTTATAAGISALLGGVTEPGIYGVLLPLKKPLIATCIGAGAGGLVIGLLQVKSYVFSSPSLISVVQFIPPEGGNNFSYAIIAAAVSVLVAFTLTMILIRKKEMPEEKVEKVSGIEETSEKPENRMVALPISGNVIPLSEIGDGVFSEEVLGKGFGIRPENERIYAPFDGVVEMVADTKHAIGLKSNDGIELLIHVGIDTVDMNGDGFDIKVKQGKKIKTGELLGMFDRKQIAAAGHPDTTAVIVTNTADYEEITILQTGNKETGSRIMCCK